MTSKTPNKDETKSEAKKETLHQPGTKLDPNLLEEDDEFEEFPVQDWKGKETDDDQDMKIWEDNWDDETHEDDFANQLRAELERTGHKEPQK